MAEKTSRDHQSQCTVPVVENPVWDAANAKDGSVICFLKCADKFQSRYAVLGFSDTARLDDGSMWPVEFALKELTAANEQRICALVKDAVN